MRELQNVSLQLIGGPTAVIEYGGRRWLTDPTLSAPGQFEGGLEKLTGPAVTEAQIEPIDIVLLSHDHHADNLDPGGRAFLAKVARVLTTEAGATRLGTNATGLAPWSSLEIPNSDGPSTNVTAVPALHGPEGSDPVTGPVTGFVLAAEGFPTVYVSGDNASVEVVRGIADRIGTIDIAVLFAGAVQLPHRFDGAYLTLSSDHAADAARILGAKHVVPLHFEGWRHFTQGADGLRAAFAGNQLSDRLVMLDRGEKVVL